VPDDGNDRVGSCASLDSVGGCEEWRMFVAQNHLGVAAIGHHIWSVFLFWYSFFFEGFCSGTLGRRPQINLTGWAFNYCGLVGPVLLQFGVKQQLDQAQGRGGIVYLAWPIIYVHYS